MSWQSRSDTGLAIIGQVHDALKIADKWRVDEPRGFMWWASDFAQRIWSDPGIFHQTHSVFRLHAETEIIRGRGHAKEHEVFLSHLLARATLSALVYDEQADTYKLHCSAYASEDNAEWLSRLFLSAVGIQISEAHTRSSQLATDMKSAAASTSHPSSGMRNEADPMCAAIERFFKPGGALPSRWEGVAEWEEARYNVRRLAQKVSTDDKSFLHAEFPWEGDPTHGDCVGLEVTTQRPHPDMGNGLLFRLVLPVHMDEEHAARTALAMNEAERSEWKWIHDLGSWCCESDQVEFNCFVPNTSYNKRVLPELVHEMAIRANWASEIAGAELSGRAHLA